MILYLVALSTGKRLGFLDYRYLIRISSLDSTSDNVGVVRRNSGRGLHDDTERLFPPNIPKSSWT
jgi:hypothetical protein